MASSDIVYVESTGEDFKALARHVAEVQRQVERLCMVPASAMKAQDYSSAQIARIQLRAWADQLSLPTTSPGAP